MAAVKHAQPADLVYDATLVFWRAVTNIFFREVRPRGAFNIPREGPVIFVAAPHNNQFLDPLLLYREVHRETGRHVRSLIAAKSMKRKVVGFFAGLMGSIPVVRAADDAKPGTGEVTISEEDATLIIGHGTKFTSDFTPKMQIMLPKSVGSLVAEVTEILSDTQLRIKKEFSGTAKLREKNKEIQAAGQRGFAFKKLPFVDQGKMYQYVYQCLTEGGAICIFPEGGSHDRTDLLPLKAGVSLMALGAMANNPNLKVKLVPVGLSYFHAHRFRSRAVIEFGSPLDVPLEFVEMFKEGGAKKREAVGKFLDVIYDALKTVTLRAPDYDTLMLIQAARRLYKTPGQHLTLGQVVELNKRFLQGYLHFKDEPKVQKLRDDVLRYNRLLRDLGLRDHQVPRAEKAGWKTFGLLTYRLGLLAVWTVLALPGVILNGPIFVTASVISRKKAKEALAASEVKIAGRDVLATWKILVALGVTPVLYAFYAVLATIVAVKAGVPLKWRIWTPFLVLMTLPILAYSALKFGEAGMDVLKSLRPLIIALIPGQQRSLQRLKRMREEVSNELVETINEFGPQMFEDFDEWRILVPSATAPPSSGQPGIWRRKTATGGVDAQGNLLVHPMTWLDERLFGWSRSAKRGTSAWAGTRSHDISRVPTPDASDDEDHPDYDDLNIPSGDGYLLATRPRSQRSSYADIQRLRLTGASNAGVSSGGPLSPLSPVSATAVSTGEQYTDNDGLHFRGQTRVRKQSLSDGVPVEVIGSVDREEPFKDATQELNQEMDKRRESQSP
ncbi:glycerol-3-phosphate O-acyltransferase [Dichomitus squalens]|uniref:Glycerol-3-phosphate O-acyltransferase n=1 Tax=Dichomitus squalens TaxID=114155 RepID=A0A4Q9QF71_9APHY|nr:glycerol-3-phosphate O-acyltransferase [Dichomitus squalens LYAD-421 SS1]EJF65776.1 glycerol-3-phosphate O-acyltransferase [Dichomitus squalens LYAD-421 SS1]TBU32404.1 glycerol-3-phosphate O-acyltransferase [Dichomitus squalens]TBU50682.1 glycerol-3-phosphate O-acyltransferase [Dichomitus squalens]TBU65926.1 glycerol-3-phosphate O-acyltransferase [Dichomitus squalens]